MTHLSDYYLFKIFLKSYILRFDMLTSFEEDRLHPIRQDEFSHGPVVEFVLDIIHRLGTSHEGHEYRSGVGWCLSSMVKSVEHQRPDIQDI